MLRTEAYHAPGYYDLVHSHYWLSGQVGALARDRWGVPLVHSMHTMAKVKNAALADGRHPRADGPVIGEEQVVAAADMLIANTDDEAKQLIDLYDADPARVEVVHPGVDLDVFRPTSQAAARAGWASPPDADLLVFVGRIQPLKAPDVLLRAAADLLAPRPGAALVAAGRGRRWPLGLRAGYPDSLARLAARLGVADVVRFVPPVARTELVDWYAAASAGLRPVVQRVVRAGRDRGPGASAPRSSPPPSAG